MDRQENTALIIVDVQNDFCEGGRLAVAGGNAIVPNVNRMAAYARERGWDVIFSRDWHPEEMDPHFKTFPPHCMGQSDDPEKFMGAMFHPDLHIEPDDFLVYKGTNANVNAFSAFDARLEASGPMPGIYAASLGVILIVFEIQRVLACGLATDYCVKATALDAQKFGFETYLLTDAIAAVNINPDDGQKAIDEMAAAGVKLTTVAEVCGE